MSSSQVQSEIAQGDVELRVSRQIDAACELALFGASARARGVCAALFLNQIPLLAQKPSLRQSFIECLLLLNMTELLIRLVRAVDGVDLRVTTLSLPASGRLLLAFGNGAMLTIPALGPEVGRATRAKRAARWSEAVLEAAARDPGFEQERSEAKRILTMADGVA